MSLRLDGHVDQDKSDYPSFRVSEIITIQVSQSLIKFLYKQKDFLQILRSTTNY
jgi:hypothetical protein